MTVYRDYTRARIGWFFGLTGFQLAVLAAAVLPVAWSVSKQDWIAVTLFAAAWGLLFLVLAVPVRGRSMTGWIAATVGLAAGALAGWTRFRSRAAAGPFSRSKARRTRRRVGVSIGALPSWKEPISRTMPR